MFKFEVGKMYPWKHRIILEEKISWYRCERRTEKSVWMSYRKDDGTFAEPVMFRIREYGWEGSENHCEYVAGQGRGNPRSCWYSSGVQIMAKDVKN